MLEGAPSLPVSHAAPRSSRFPGPFRRPCAAERGGGAGHAHRGLARHRRLSGCATAASAAGGRQIARHGGNMVWVDEKCL